VTYCVGMLMDAGLVFLSDTRTNAGVDQINTFRKMSVFEQPGERVLVLLSAGNLAITQAVVSLLFERQGKEGESLLTAPNLFEAARHVGDCLREVHDRDAAALAGFNIDFNAAFLLGGQIKGEAPRCSAFMPPAILSKPRRYAVFPDWRIEIRQTDPGSHLQWQSSLEEPPNAP
jgi:putative proteasome-type protease